MPTYYRSQNYQGAAADVQDIVNLFGTLAWPEGVHTVYITNGWHTGFEVRDGEGKMVTYCGYCCNEDNPNYKQHYYLN